ncbi:MAG: hypothetical protein K0S04_2678 [Herbinix sp.]|nr:hypothetical protein [Herbinix sp.]
MKRWYDVAYAVILIMILIIAFLIGNAIISGILLLLFSAILIINTSYKLSRKKGDKFKYKVFLMILLLLDTILALGAIIVVINGIITM